MKKENKHLIHLTTIRNDSIRSNGYPAGDSLLTTLEWGKRQTDTTGNRKDYNRSGSRKPVERNCGNNGKRLKRYVRLELSGNLRKTEKSFYLSVSEKNRLHHWEKKAMNWIYATM